MFVRDLGPRAFTRSPLPSQRRRARRQQEGAVMLVVMLILMIATASAAVSIRSTQAEIQAAGQERLGTQARLAAEAALTSTISYIDMLGEAQRMRDLWTKADPNNPPQMYRFGQPNLTPGTDMQAARIWARDLKDVRQSYEVAALSNASTQTGADLLGSFGPRQSYSLVADNGEATTSVDMTDCRLAPSGSIAGTEVEGGSTTKNLPRQYNCVLTARARIHLATSTQVRSWAFGGVTYAQDPYERGHDSCATILTPEDSSVP
jgi:type II secretory pathway pseudopilin PulG